MTLRVLCALTSPWRMSPSFGFVSGGREEVLVPRSLKLLWPNSVPPLPMPQQMETQNKGLCHIGFCHVLKQNALLGAHTPLGEKRDSPFLGMHSLAGSESLIGPERVCARTSVGRRAWVQTPAGRCRRLFKHYIWA